MEERSRIIAAGLKNYNVFIDVDLTKPQEKSDFLEYARELKQRIENKSGAYDDERMGQWVSCSPDALDRLQIAINYIAAIKCNAGFTRIPSLGKEGWMVTDKAGLFWNQQCQISVFDPVTKFDDETLFRLRTTTFAIKDGQFFRLNFLQEVVKQANYIIFDGSHFFPMEVPPDDSALFERALDHFCGILLDCLKRCNNFQYFNTFVNQCNIIFYSF